MKKKSKKKVVQGQQRIYSVENRKNMTTEELIVSLREKIQEVLKK